MHSIVVFEILFESSSWADEQLGQHGFDAKTRRDVESKQRAHQHTESFFYGYRKIGIFDHFSKSP